MSTYASGAAQPNINLASFAGIGVNTNVVLVPWTGTPRASGACTRSSWAPHLTATEMLHLTGASSPDPRHAEQPNHLPESNRRCLVVLLLPAKRAGADAKKGFPQRVRMATESVPRGDHRLRKRISRE
jgi:hypothetical protein